MHVGVPGQLCGLCSLRSPCVWFLELELRSSGLHDRYLYSLRHLTHFLCIFFNHCVPGMFKTCPYTNISYCFKWMVLSTLPVFLNMEDP